MDASLEWSGNGDKSLAKHNGVESRHLLRVGYRYTEQKETIIMQVETPLFERAVVGVSPTIATVATLGSTSAIVDACYGGGGVRCLWQWRRRWR